MGKRISVVEDDADILSVLIEVLASEGYKTSGFDSAAAALAAIERQPPDLLITDLAMPGMRGEELIARVRGHPGGESEDRPEPNACTELPILVISAASPQAASHLPIQGFIGKPYELADLLAQVARWVRDTVPVSRPMRHLP